MNTVTQDQIGCHATVTIHGRITRVIAGRIVYLTVDGSDTETIFEPPGACPDGITWQVDDPGPRVTVRRTDTAWAWHCRGGHGGAAPSELAAWQKAAAHPCDHKGKP